MYTLEELQAKTFKELKAIGYQLNALPAGDRRCRQNWIDAIAGVNLPLLQLLEVSPAEEVESVAEAIEVQRQEPPIESKFGRIVYPKLSIQPIAQEAENSPGVSFDIEEFQQTHAAEIESYFASFTEGEQPPNRGDNGRDRLEVEPKLSQSAMAFRPASYGFCASPVTFSPRFLAAYPPYFGEIHYKADAAGQLNLLEPVTDDEPPDPDDFADIDVFREALARWDAEHPPEPLEVSLASMSEWAPCPDEWYEPETNETNETGSCTLGIPPVSVESSTTCNFSIPTFDGFADRPNDTDEPPDTGVFARLPKPKPPVFRRCTSLRAIAPAALKISPAARHF